MILGTGRALLPFFPGKASRLRAGEVPLEPTPWEKLLLAGIEDQHGCRGGLETVPAPRAGAAEVDSSIDFLVPAEHRLTDVFLRHQAAAIVPQIREAMATCSGGYTRVCEIGCGSGLVLEHLARELPGAAEFVGIAASPRHAECNRRRVTDVRLRFEAGEALAWVLRHGQRHSVFVTNGGVLEYFPVRRVEALLAWVAGALAPAVVAIVEPLAEGHDPDTQGWSLPFGTEGTFSHAYPVLFERAGLQMRWRRETVVGTQRWLMLVAHAPETPGSRRRGGRG